MNHALWFPLLFRALRAEKIIAGEGYRPEITNSWSGNRGARFLNGTLSGWELNEVRFGQKKVVGKSLDDCDCDLIPVSYGLCM